MADTILPSGSQETAQWQTLFCLWEARKRYSGRHYFAFGKPGNDTEPVTISPLHRKQEMTAQDDFQQQVVLLREQFNDSLRTGEFPQALMESVRQLQERAQALLTQALPLARRQLLDRKDIGAILVPLVCPPGTGDGSASFQSGDSFSGAGNAGGTGAGNAEGSAMTTQAGQMQTGRIMTGPQELTQKELDEAGLSPAEMQLCQQLLSQDPPQDPWFPQGCGYDPSSASPYMSVSNASTCFLFLDDGSVILFENNDGWQWRREPILQECFAENAVMESDHSCLLCNLDHGIDRLQYNRLENPDDLKQMPMFPDAAAHS